MLRGCELVDFQPEMKDYDPGISLSLMTLRKQSNSTPPPDRALQWLMVCGCWVVVLWVRFGATDSTLGKSEILFTVVSLIAILFLVKQLWTGEITWKKSSAGMILAGIIAASTISFFFSPFRSYGEEALILVVSYGLCFLTGVQLFRNRQSIRGFLDQLGLLSFAVSLVALVQYAGVLDIEFDLGSSRRVVSTLGNATYLADFLSVMIPVQTGAVIASQNTRRKFLGGSLIVLMVAVLFLTQARTGIIVTGAVLLFMFVILRWSRPLLAGAILLGIGLVTTLLVLVVPGVGGRLLELSRPGENVSVARRVIFWEAGLASVPDSPILGHGPGSYPFVVAGYRTPDYWVSGSEDIVPHAHNELLETVVETGLAGLVLNLLLIGYLLLHARKAITAGGTWSRITALAISGGLIALFLDNMTGVSLRQAPIGMIGWTLAGILLSEFFRKDAVTTLTIPVLPARIAGGLLSLLWIIGMFFYWHGAAARFRSDALMFQGRQAVSEGDHRGAAAYFREAVSADRSNHVARFDFTIASLRSGEPAKGLEMAEAIRSEFPAYPKINLLESLAFLELDSLDHALRSITEEVRLRDHPEAFYTRSLILARMDDTDGVREALEQVLERNIVGMSQVHLESSARTLAEIAETPEQLERLRTLLVRIARYAPGNQVVTGLLGTIEQRRQAPRER
ncbi:MAG: O-antigen ligase family protein [Ignavibacteria bacterium]|nr:O-antigen ligase family protein [Ignavibacteria bacterium]